MEYVTQNVSIRGSEVKKVTISHPMYERVKETVEALQNGDLEFDHAMHFLMGEIRRASLGQDVKVENMRKEDYDLEWFAFWSLIIYFFGMLTMYFIFIKA